MSNFDPSPSSEVTIEMELFFQLQSLVTGVSLPASFPFCNIKGIHYKMSVVSVELASYYTDCIHRTS